MDKRIEDFKRYYLETPPPMEAGEGFADVLLRIEKANPDPIYKRPMLYIGLAVLLVAAVAASSFILPQNTVTNAVKAAKGMVIQKIFQSSPTPTPSANFELLNRKPTATTTPTPTREIKANENGLKAPGRVISDQKRDENNESNVKGTSDSQDNHPSQNEDKPAQGNSGDHRNDDEQDNRSAEKEKNNGKKEDD